MNEIEKDVIEYQERIIKENLLNKIRKLNKTDFSEFKKIDTIKIKRIIKKILENENKMTIDEISRLTGVIVSYLHFENNEQYKENEIIILNEKEKSIINIVGYYVECFIGKYETSSIKYDCEIIKTNKKIIKTINKKVKEVNKEKFIQPFSKEYITDLISKLMYPTTVNTIMTSHSFFTGYIQGISVILEITTKEEEKSISRILFQELYKEFEIKK